MNVLSDTEMQETLQQRQDNLVSNFVESLSITSELAIKLVNANVNSIEEIAFMPEDELLVITELDADAVANIRSKANDVMLMDMLQQ